MRLSVSLGTIIGIGLLVAGAGAAPGPITPAPAFSPEELTATPNGDWITTGGNIYNQRYSTLDQIDTSNVSRLKVAWTTHLDQSGMGTKFSAEATPLVHNGVMYIVTGNHDVFALNAATGEHLWKYSAQLPKDLSTACCGWVSRGVALGEGKVFVAQLNGVLVALDQITGGVVWKTLNARWQEGYTMTMSPTYYEGKVFVGTSGAEYGCRCHETAYDATTGKRLWRFFAIPEPGETGGATWPANSEWQTGGGGIWGNPAFDPSTNTLVFTTGNADAYSGRGPGANLFTSSFVALDIDTGQLKWFYQMVHHDIWDYDCPSPPVMFEATINGRPRHAIAEACKTGWIYHLDRTNGQPTIGIKEVKVPQIEAQRTWPTQPKPIGDPFSAQCARRQDYKEEAPDGKPVKIACIFEPYWTGRFVASAPGYNGGTDWQPMSYNPRTQALYVCGGDTASAYAAIPPVHKQEFVGGESYFNVLFIPPTGLVTWGGTFTAMDVRTNKIIWQKKFRSSNPKKPDTCYSGSFTTAGNLVFVGRNDGTYEAYDAADGKLLWSMKLPYGANAPGMTYSVEGKQYVALLDGGTTGDGGPPTKRGDAVYAFALEN